MKFNLTQIRNIAQYAPHRVYALILISVGVLGLGLATFAFGPDRQTYTIENPADHVVFDSITNNPNWGDERNMVLARPATSTSNNDWRDDLTVEPGKEYTVKMIVHNNAADNLNLVATNTRVNVNILVTTGTSASIQGAIMSDNSTPGKIWDNVVLNSPNKFNVGLVPGSARYYNNINNTTGFALPDSISSAAGTLVGYESMDGNIPGCFKYSGFVYFNVKIYGQTTADFTVQKQVRPHVDGQKGNWQKAISAKAGDKIDYMITYKNTGQATQNNVVVKDSLPANVSYNKGSSDLTNASNPNSLKISDNVTTPNGVNISSYSTGANAFVYFESTIGAEKDLPQCGNNILRNTGTVTTDYGTKQDTADVTVNKECKDKSSYSCDALQANKISQLEYSYNVNLTGNKATAKEVTIDFGDGQTAVRSVSALPVNHTYAAAGQYTVTAKASFEVDGKTVKDVTSDACKVVVNTEVTPPTTGTTAGTPDSIASTGPAEVIGSVLGISALGIGIQQWYASRRAVAEAIHHSN